MFASQRLLLGVFFAFLLSFALLQTGCSPKGPIKVRISGSVTMEGTPIEEGEIYFVESQTSGPIVLQIAKGKFEGMVTVGSKRVEIYSYKTPTTPAKVQMGPEPTINLVHADFNVNSKITAVVGADGLVVPAQFDVKRDKTVK